LQVILFYNILKKVISQYFNLMNKEIKIGHFCFSYPLENNAYSQIYIAEPEQKFLERFGCLCILLNLNFKKEEKKQTLDWIKKWSSDLITLIKNDFYNPLRTNVEIEKDFEDSLQRINNWLKQEKIENQEIFERYLNQIDIDIILIKDNKVYFSQSGNIETHLLKENKLVDLIENKNNNGRFSNIVSGELEKDTLLFFTNKEIFEYFSKQKIIQFLEKTETERINKEIKQLFSEETKKLNLFGLIISKKEFKKEKKELETEQPKKRKEEKPIKEKRKEEKPSINPLMKNLKQEKLIEKGLKISREKLDLPIVKTSRLKYFRKSLLIAIIVLALIFIQSIVILARQQVKTRRAKEYAEAIQQIKIKEDNLSNALIYQDPLKIKRSANEFKQVLNELPQETEEQQETYAYFEKKYQEKMNQFYNLITLDEPFLLADLKEKESNINPCGFTNIGNDFYIFDSENNYIYLFNIESKNFDLVNKISSNVGRLKKITALDNDNLIGLDQNQGFAVFNTIDKILSPIKIITKFINIKKLLTDLDKKMHG